MGLRVSMLDKTTTVYADPNKGSSIITVLSQRDQATLGKTIKKDGAQWVEITLDSNQSGYVDGQVRIYHVRKVMLDQSKADVYSSPSKESVIIKTLTKKEEFTLTSLVNNDQWCELLTEDNEKGYVFSSIRIKELNHDCMFAEENYKAFMQGVFILGGLLILPLTYGNGIGMGYGEALPWSLGSCLVIFAGFKKNGSFSWLRAIPAIILLMVASILYSKNTGKPSFAAGGILGFLLIMICGYLGIAVKKLNKKFLKT